MDKLFVIYTSRFVRPQTDDEMNGLCRQSDLYNRKAAVTGILLSYGNYVVQALEGPVAAVVDLLDRIIKDRRHTDVRIIDIRMTDHRLFHDWHCRFFDLDHYFREESSRYERAVKAYFEGADDLARSVIDLCADFRPILEAYDS